MPMIALLHAMTRCLAHTAFGRGLRAWCAVWSQRAVLPVVQRRRFLRWSAVYVVLGWAAVGNLLNYAINLAHPWCMALTWATAPITLLTILVWVSTEPAKYLATIRLRQSVVKRWWGLA